MNNLRSEENHPDQRQNPHGRRRDDRGPDSCNVYVHHLHITFEAGSYATLAEPRSNPKNIPDNADAERNGSE